MGQFYSTFTVLHLNHMQTEKLIIAHFNKGVHIKLHSITSLTYLPQFSPTDRLWNCWFSSLKVRITSSSCHFSGRDEVNLYECECDHVTPASKVPQIGWGLVCFLSNSFIKGCICVCVCVCSWVWFTSWLWWYSGDGLLQLPLYKTVTSNTHIRTHT